MEAQGSRGVVAREQRGEGGVDRIVAGLHVHRLAGHAVQFAARSRNPVTRLCELKPIVASNVSYKYNRLRWPSVVRWRTISRMPALSSMPTEAVNPCEAVLMPMSGIRVVLSRLISAGVMANDETDDRVRVAAHRQFVEELLARARVADRLDDQNRSRPIAALR